MRLSLVYIVLTLLCISAIKLIFLIFQDIIDGWILASSSIALGIIVGIVLWLVFDHLNIAMSFFIGVFSSAILIQTINYKLASNEISKKHFKIVKTGKSYVRYHQFQYLKITNNSGVTIVISNDLDIQFKKGDDIIVSTIKGFWGLPIVTSIAKTKI